MTKKEVKKDSVLSNESAVAELQRFYDNYDIDLKDEDDGETRDLFKGVEKKVIRGIKAGLISFDDDDDERGFSVVQQMKNGDPLIYKELDGMAKVLMGKNKGSHEEKIYALMGNLCGLGPGTIKKLRGRNLSLCECIGALLLNV